jgi:hypothetical protein
MARPNETNGSIGGISGSGDEYSNVRGLGLCEKGAYRGYVHFSPFKQEKHIIIIIIILSLILIRLNWGGTLF